MRQAEYSGKTGKASTHLWTDARMATMNPALPEQGVIEDGALVSVDGRIAFIGRQAQLPPQFRNAQTTSCQGRWITPGLVDCHTHLVHAGNRAHEFELRLAGATYEEIARAGGGIVSSVKAVREASEESLIAEALPRLDALLAEGITTLEIKSGYGLSVEAELKMLRVARKLASLRPVRIRTSYLAAHAVPVEFKGSTADYIDQVVLPGLVLAAQEKLVDAVDGFCEGIAFSPQEMRRIFDSAKKIGLPVKLHADQLSNLGGARLAAEYGAISADHLEYTDEDGCAAMAASGTVAVILPGAYYFLREKQKPPIDLFRKHKVPMAIATDNNPGSSPLTSLLLAMNMAATLFGLTTQECLAGVTREAARALGMLDQVGTLEVGKAADLAIWNIERPAELVYRMGFNPLHQRIIGGVTTP